MEGIALGGGGFFRNGTESLLDERGASQLSPEEQAANPYRPQPVPLAYIPEGRHKCLVRFFGEPRECVSGDAVYQVEVVEGVALGNTWEQRIKLGPKHYVAAFEAIGKQPPATKPSRYGDEHIREFIGQGAWVDVAKDRKRKLQIVDWYPFNEERECLTYQGRNHAGSDPLL